MPRKIDSADTFLGSYQQEREVLLKAAPRLENLIKQLLKDRQFGIHQVTYRVKNFDSVLWKVRQKQYKNPANELTDMIGVRVITYYQNDVDKVVQKLKDEFEVDSSRSVDRRLALDLREFGYRSVHLISRLRGYRAASTEYAALANRWFEIQVRSLLEHGWAEIEHEVVYKAGIRYPKDISRRFAALAATLELVEKEFLTLKSEREKLLDHYRLRYDEKLDGKSQLDSARLVSFMESVWAHNPGWRALAKQEKPFPHHIETRCVAALRLAHVSTADSLRNLFKSTRFRRALKAYTSARPIPLSEATHLALIILALGVRSFPALRRYFPEFASGVIADAIKLNRKRRRQPSGRE